MNFSILTAAKAIEFDIIPEQLKQRLTENDGFLVTAHDEDNLTGIAVFSYTVYPDYVNLDYIRVSEGCRDQGISSGMLDFASGIMKKAGVKTLGCMLIGSMDFIAPLYTYLQAQNFTPVIAFDHSMTYQLNDILDNKNFAPMFKNIPPNILAPKDIPAQTLRRLGNHLADQGINITDSNFDKELSRFYVKGNEIAGCMFVSYSGSIYEMVFTTTFPDPGDVIAIPAMLASCAIAVSQKVKGDTPFRLFVHNIDLYNSLNRVIGTPREELIIQKYERQLT